MLDPIVLRVEDWALIAQDPQTGKEVSEGSVAPQDRIPGGLRRRMARFDQLATRVALGVYRPGRKEQGGEEVIFCSRYGNVSSAYALMKSVVDAELLSPTSFSMSVHNAIPGLTMQLAETRASHTAIAAGPGTTQAGLLEAYARLRVEASAVVVVFADQPLPPPYLEFDDEDAPEMFLAVRLSLPMAGAAASSHRVARRGRAELHDLAATLRAGATLLQVAL